MTEHAITRTQAWLESLRPKTLPLAFSAIVVGTTLAWHQGYFDPWVALLALITAGLLQILSNLANDYGDAVKGSDKPDRIGPLRGMQKGAITQPQMKRALENFKAVLDLRVNHGDTSDAQIKKIIGIIDRAALDIAQLD